MFAMSLSACAQSDVYAQAASTPVPTVAMPAAVATLAPTPTATLYPTPITQWDQHFKQLDEAIVIPTGKDRVTVPYLGSNGQYYLIQKYIDPSTQKVDFAFYNAAKVWVQSTDPKKAQEVVVPQGKNIGMEQFFFEAVKVKWLTASDFKDLPTLENDPWYTNP